MAVIAMLLTPRALLPKLVDFKCIDFKDMKYKILLLFLQRGLDFWQLNYILCFYY